MKGVLGVLFVALVLVACNKKDSGSAPSNDARGGAGGATGQGGAAGGSSDGSPDDRLLPLANGRTWTFNVTAVGGAGGSCAPGVQTARVLSVTTESGQPAYAYHPICSDSDFVLVGAGDKLLAHPTTALDPSFVYLDTPVAEGHTWQDAAGRTLTWHGVGAVTVAAGTSPDCWDRQLTSPTENGAVTFCRGIGQVRYSFSTYTAELQSKNF